MTQVSRTDAGRATSSSVRRIHIDTDPGLDDLLALALALASPEVKVEGITTVAGNARIEAVTENTLRLLALAGVDIPVGRGATGPLALTAVNAEDLHGVDGRRGLPLPEPRTRPSATAPEVLRHSLRERHVEQIVALGPLTNIANLLQDEPELLHDVELVWMGGTLSGGNVTAVAEFNAYADPRAADEILTADLEIRVIGLDVTEQVAVREPDLRAAGFGDSPTERTLSGILRALMELGQAPGGEPCAVLHDPCALAAVIDPSLLRYEPRQLRAHVTTGRDRGRLWEDPSDGRAVSYGTEVRAPEVIQLVLSRLVAWSARLASA